MGVNQAIEEACLNRKQWVRPIVPRLDFSRLHSDADSIVAADSNVQWDILVAVKSPKAPENEYVNFSNNVPKLDVTSMNSITGVSVQENSNTSVANPWEYKKPLNTYTIIDNSPNYLNISQVQQLINSKGHYKSFMQRYSKTKSLQFIRRISEGDSSCSSSFDNSSMLRPLTIANWGAQLEKPLLSIKADEFIRYYHNVKIMKQPALKICSGFRITKERSKIGRTRQQAKRNERFDTSRT